MIQELVNKYMAKQKELRDILKQKHPASYADLVKTVIELIADDEYGEYSPDPERIHEIDDGDYQGTLVYVIAEKGYQPSTYYITMVSYGSCSGCDTLQSISAYSDEPPNEEQVKDYMSLCLHIVQKLSEVKSY